MLHFDTAGSRSISKATAGNKKHFLVLIKVFTIKVAILSNPCL